MAEKIAERQRAAQQTSALNETSSPKMDSEIPVVNRWNDFDPLEEVVLGIADDACFPPMEPACQSEFNDQHTSAQVMGTSVSDHRLKSASSKAAQMIVCWPSMCLAC